MVPSDPAKAQVVPVPPRPFPVALHDRDLRPPPRHPSDLAAMIWGAVALLGIPWLLVRLVRRRRS